MWGPFKFLCTKLATSIAFTSLALFTCAHAGDPQKLTHETVDRFLALAPEVNEICRSIEPKMVGFDEDRFYDAAFEAWSRTELTISKVSTIWLLGLIEAQGEGEAITHITKTAGYDSSEEYFSQSDLMFKTIMLWDVDKVIKDYISELRKMTPASLTAMKAESELLHQSLKFLYDYHADKEEVTTASVVEGLKAYLLESEEQCRCGDDWKIRFALNFFMPVMEDLKYFTEDQLDLALSGLVQFVDIAQSCENVLSSDTEWLSGVALQNGRIELFEDQKASTN